MLLKDYIARKEHVIVPLCDKFYNLQYTNEVKFYLKRMVKHINSNYEIDYIEFVWSPDSRVAQEFSFEYDYYLESTKISNGITL